MTDSAEVTFDGTKFYWRTRNTVDVVIAHHKAQQVFEVIVYEPSLDVEAPRLYLDETILMPKVDHSEANSKISFAKRNDVPLTEKFVQGIMNKAIADFILNRLILVELTQSTRAFVVDMKIDDYDVMLSPNFRALVCRRPDALVMHETKHFKNHMRDAAIAVVRALEEEKKQLAEICEVAAELSARVTPIVRDRWRMPIVLNKVLHGTRLCPNDAKIFEKIKANLKNDEDVTRMNAAMHGKGSGHHNPIMKHDAAVKPRVEHIPHRGHLSREVSFNSHMHSVPDAHALHALPAAHVGAHRDGSGGAKSHAHEGHEGQDPSAAAESSVTVRYGADAMAPLKRQASDSGRGSTGSAGKSSVGPKVIPHSTNKPAHTKKKAKRTGGHKAARVALGSDPHTPDERFPDTASQLSDSGDQDDPQDATTPTHYMRVVDGLNTLGASLRANFSFKSTDAQASGKGYEAPEAATGTATADCSAGYGDSCAGPAPSVQANVSDGESAVGVGGGGDLMDAPFTASAVSAKGVLRRSSALGSYLWNLTTGLFPDAQGTPPPSRRASAAIPALAGWTSSKKVVPAQ